MLSLLRRRLVVACSLLLVGAMMLAGCSDDPVLGPEGPSDSGGGSYGVINQIAPDDSSAASPASNPEQF